MAWRVASVRGVKYLSFIKSTLNTFQVLCHSKLQYLILPQDGNIPSDLNHKILLQLIYLFGFHSALLFSVLEVSIRETIIFKQDSFLILFYIIYNEVV